MTSHSRFQELVVAAAEDGAAHGRVERECVLDNGLEPDREMALEAMHEIEDLPEHPQLLGAFRRAYVAAFLNDSEEE